MRNIKLTLEYDGSDFFGFQKQPSCRTIQSELERALSKLLNQPTKIVAASGRTDTGVHAQGQVVNFKTDKKHTLNQIQKGLNRYLSDAIAVKKVTQVSGPFHARYHAVSKIYEYKILNAQVRSPLLGKQAYFFPYALDLKKMKQAAKCLQGKHDFKAFCASGSSVKEDGRKGTVRTIKKIAVTKKSDVIRIVVEADGFLYHMVRNMVGTLLDVGQGKARPNAVKNILFSLDRKKAGRTVPGDGLCLVRVKY